jgi:hypothetical protein
VIASFLLSLDSPIATMGYWGAGATVGSGIPSNRLTTDIDGPPTVLAQPEKQPGRSLRLSVGGQPPNSGICELDQFCLYPAQSPRVDLPEAINIWRMAGSGRLPTGGATTRPPLHYRQLRCQRTVLP